MGGPSDGELVARVRAGDSAAFAELYRAHAPAVAAAVRANVTGSEAIADAVQEAFVRALARLDSLRDAEQFRPWILAIARNAAIDERRYGRRIVGDPSIADERASSDLGPEELAELKELLAAVRGCVTALSRRDAAAVILVSELGFRPAEVGAALGISAGAAKVVVHRARRRIRAALQLQDRVREAPRRTAPVRTVSS